LAEQTRWCAAALAKNCGVSVRTLERHFHKQMGKSPKTWLAEQRQQQAIELLRNGSSVKETAAVLGYKQATNFTRKFKHHWGIVPSHKLRRPNWKMTQNDLICRKMIVYFTSPSDPCKLNW